MKKNRLLIIICSIIIIVALVSIIFYQNNQKDSDDPLFEIEKPPYELSPCFFQYFDDNQIFVGIVNSSEKAFNITMENEGNFSFRGTLNNSKYYVEYKADAEYAGNSLREGWYIEIKTDNGAGYETFFISVDGYLMRCYEHPC